MDLKTYTADIPIELRDLFAERCRTSWAHIRNVSNGYKTCGEKLAVLIEIQSGGKVSRPELRHDDWWEIWPELIGSSSVAVASTVNAEKQPISKAAA